MSLQGDRDLNTQIYEDGGKLELCWHKTRNTKNYQQPPGARIGKVSSESWPLAWQEYRPQEEGTGEGNQAESRVALNDRVRSRGSAPGAVGSELVR